MIIDNVVVKVDPTLFAEEDLKILVADAKNKFSSGNLSKIVIVADKNGGFNINYSVKNQLNL